LLYSVDAFARRDQISRCLLRERGLTEADKSRFELDHIIPLVLGGSLDDPRNLQLEQARERIWRDWRAAEETCE